MTDYTIQPQTGIVNFTPYAMAKMSDGLFNASENYNAKDTPTLNYFLYCASIELGLKAGILSQDNSLANKKHLKGPAISHDLQNLYQYFLNYFGTENLFDANDIAVLDKINPFFKTKGLEYITTDVIVALASGLSAFPKLSDLKNIALKMNKFLINNGYFN